MDGEGLQAAQVSGSLAGCLLALHELQAMLPLSCNMESLVLPMLPHTTFLPLDLIPPPSSGDMKQKAERRRKAWRPWSLQG